MNRTSFSNHHLSSLLRALLVALFCLSASARAQNEKPLESQELVRLVYQLPQHPERRAAVIEEIRRRGIGFELTSGMRSLVASKSGNDATLRRTLEEADRRRASPTTTVRPNEAEAQAALESARQATRQAAGAMPDFVVKQLITRARALGETKNYRVARRARARQLRTGQRRVFDRRVRLDAQGAVLRRGEGEVSSG
jgi:hypothetical protein